MKTILITGASGGIGSEIAKKFAKSNNTVILVYNKNKKILQNMKQSFTNCKLEIFQCDLTDTDQINAMVAKVIKNHSKIDCLVNCAGISKFQQIQDTTEKDFYEIFDTNVKSTTMLTAAVSKYMIAEQSGKIVNISSMWGVVGASMESLYSASKGAINSLTRALAKELGPSNINVNAVCPGFIDTKMNKNLSAETVINLVEETPISRIGQAGDVANIVEFLCSEKANFITGQVITVDGGLSL